MAYCWNITYQKAFEGFHDRFAGRSHILERLGGRVDAHGIVPDNVLNVCLTTFFLVNPVVAVAMLDVCTARLETVNEIRASCL